MEQQRTVALSLISRRMELTKPDPEALRILGYADTTPDPRELRLRAVQVLLDVLPAS